MVPFGAGRSRAFGHGAHAYGPLGDEPAADAHEMRNVQILKPPSTYPDSASIQSGTAPLLGVPKSQDDTSNIYAVDKERNGKARFIHGWRMGITLCAATAGTVFVINLVLTVWASVKYGLVGGVGTIQEGSCAKTKNLSLWLHLTINALSTLLLGASNYSMQCLASPTREEIDKAHKQHVWLDIGVPSVRNLRRIANYRIVLWWLLAISGVPLHLLYNSAVFSTLSSQQYLVFQASPDLFTGASVNWSTPIERYSSDHRSFTLGDFQNASNWGKLENAACIKAYAVPFVSARGNLLAVSSSANASKPIVEIGSYGGPGTGILHSNLLYSWICNAHPGSQTHGCDYNLVLQRAKTWTLLNSRDGSTFPVQHCFSKPIEEHCQVQFSVIIMSIIIVANFLKALCMFLALWRERAQPLATLGDAMDAFLRKTDPTTEALCLAEKSRFAPNGWVGGPVVWKQQQHRWFSSASKKRWLICNVLCIVTLIAAGCLLGMGLHHGNLQDTSISHLWQMGYGIVTSESLIGWNLQGSGGLLLTVLVANSPQVLLSFLFLTYNGLYTCMLLADEWNGYAHSRKPLRVTDPIGDQRSTYRLQLPYKYGIPLLILSGTLHWLVSQSLFLARVASFDTEGRKIDMNSISTVGYSCIAIITVILLGSIVVLIGILMGLRRYKPGIPLAGSCSAAISAACQRPKDDEDAAIKPIMWGAVGTKDDVGHCCFTSFEVSPPVVGERYAGLKEGTGGSTCGVSKRRAVIQDVKT